VKKINKLLSVVIPMKNEGEAMHNLFARLLPILNKLPVNYEVVVVNDGSDDNTLDLLIQKQAKLPQLKIVDLSRNFGKEAAFYAGFEYSSGDAVVSIDADLQDPPELILEMVEFWQQGYEIITATREDRSSDMYFNRKSAELFYKFINKISDTKLTPNAGDYRLLDRVAVNAFLSLKEKVRFNKGLLTWIGFKEQIIYHKREKRTAGTTKWNFWKLFKFSIDGITSFSKAPLEMWFYLGILLSFIGFCYAVFFFFKTIFCGIDTPGYPSLLTIILFFSGLQMIGIGILGKYIGRIFDESKQRPLYIARKIYNKKSN